jgi:hypothetical protein
VKNVVPASTGQIAPWVEAYAGQENALCHGPDRRQTRDDAEKELREPCHSIKKGQPKLPVEVTPCSALWLTAAANPCAS